MPIEIRPVGPEQHEAFAAPLMTAFGITPQPEFAARAQKITELTHRFAAYDGDAIVGCAGTFAFSMTTPGGSVPVAGLTMVGVLPTHRRRGIMTSLIRTHFAAARADKQPVSSLWASEGSIYRRFGYGLASHACSISLDHDRAAFIDPPGPGAEASRTRLVSHEEARAIFPAIWDRARTSTPGMASRSPSWWEYRRLIDREKGSAPPLLRMVLEIDGRPEGYALYRQGHRFDPNQLPAGNLQVIEAIGATPLAMRLVWAYLCEVDLMVRIEAQLLPPDHPLIHMLREPRRLRLTQSDGIWMRLLDIEAALGERSYGSHDAVVLEVEDAFCPENSGRYHVDGAAGLARRTDRPAELRLDVATLGSAYLGGFTFRRLADAGRVEEVVEGALDRADALFRSPRAPWCPEIF